MGITIKLDVKSADQILKSRGLGPNGEVQKHFTKMVFKLSKPYTPLYKKFLSEKNVNVGTDFLEYDVPYARYQWYGFAMTGKPRKEVARDKPLKYFQAPMRGKEWIYRMWKDRKDEILDSIARMAGGRPG